MTLNFDLTGGLGLGFSLSNFKVTISPEWEGCNKGNVSQYDFGPTK